MALELLPEEQQERFLKQRELKTFCANLGSNTPTNVVKATINGLKSMRTLSDIARLRNKTMAQLTGQEEK